MTARQWLRAHRTRAADRLRAVLGPHPDVAADLVHARSEVARLRRELAASSARHDAEMRGARGRVAAAQRRADTRWGVRPAGHRMAETGDGS